MIDLLNEVIRYPWLGLGGAAVVLSALPLWIFLRRRGSALALAIHVVALGCALVLAAVPRLPRQASPRIRTVFVVDTSTSVTKDMLQTVEQELQDIISRYGTYYEGYDSQVAVMAFARRTKLVVPWSKASEGGWLRRLDLSQAALRADKTDISYALESAARYLREARADVRQLVLLTDGKDAVRTTVPDSTARLLKGIPLDIRNLRPLKGPPKVWIQDLTLSGTSRINEPNVILVACQTNARRQRVTVHLRMKIDGRAFTYSLDGKKTASWKRTIEPVCPEVAVPLADIGKEIVRPGYHRVEVELFDPKNGDVLDSQARVVKYYPSARILIVEDRPHDSNSFSNLASNVLLKELKTKTVGVSTANFNTEQKRLSDYDLVVLYNIPGSFFTSNRLRLLNAYVKAKGGGLLFVGGYNTFDFGGYRGNEELEQLLPVTIQDPKDHLRKGLFVFLLDFSSSMSGPRIQILKRSVINTLQQIPIDGKNRVKIYIFDEKVDEIFAAQLTGDSLKKAIDAIQGKRPDGGTNLMPALKASIADTTAYLARNDKPGVGARIYVISDGEFRMHRTPFFELDRMARQLDMRIQVATMTVGARRPAIHLAMLSRAGGTDALVSSTLLAAKHFDPGVDPKKPLRIKTQCLSGDPILGNLFEKAGCPDVHGYNNIVAKHKARSPWFVKDRQIEPASLLTSHELGSGRVVTVGMDLNGLWSAPLRQLMAPLVKQVILYTRRSERHSDLFTQIRLVQTLDGRLRVRYTAAHSQVGPLQFSLAATGGGALSLPGYRGQQFKLVSRGVFEAEVNLPPKKDRYGVRVYDARGEILEVADVWLESEEIFPEHLARPNGDYLTELEKRTQVLSYRYIESDLFWFNQAFINLMEQEKIDDGIVACVKRNEGAWVLNIDHFKQLKAELCSHNKAASPAQREKETDSIAKVFDDAKYIAFKLPMKQRLQVPFFELWYGKVLIGVQLVLLLVMVFLRRRIPRWR